jgi:hypothetical protein
MLLQLSNSSLWETSSIPPSHYFEPGSIYEKDVFVPFVQKNILKEDSIIGIWGDIHGSDCSLSRTLIHFREKIGCLSEDFMLRENCFVIFLGDFADRGPNGLEVYFTLMKLKLNNPSQVYLVRGNHEDERLIESYGFMRVRILKC